MYINRIANKAVAVIWPMAIVLALAFVLVVLSITRENRADKQAKAGNDVAEIVRKMAVVPAENPQVTEVKDVADFQQKPYFDRLTAGDLVLEYLESSKVVVFRPSRKSVVFLSDVPRRPTIEPIRVEIEIRNGSAYLGAAAELASILKKDQAFSILDVNQAKAKSYAQSRIIDLSNGRFPEELKKISELVKGEIATGTPSEEEESKADFLIIIGNNK